MEQWVKLNEFPNYSVSSFGNIRNDITGYIFVGTPRPDGYVRVTLVSAEGRVVQKMAHQLVASAFCNFKNKGVIDHKDRNRSNNRSDNLLNVTQKKNCQNKDHVNNKARPVVQMSMAGKIVARYPRIKDCPCNSKNVISVCRGKLKSACGYRWAYDPQEVSKNEKWRTVKFSNRSVPVSNLGRVKLPSGAATYGFLTPSGYRSVTINKKSTMVHRLVCLAFHGPKPFLKSEVDHKDRNRENNLEENLRWATATENSKNRRCEYRKLRRTPIVSIDNLGEKRSYQSIAEAAALTKISRGNICMCAKGVRPKAGGLKWQYLAR